MRIPSTILTSLFLAALVTAQDPEPKPVVREDGVQGKTEQDAKKEKVAGTTTQQTGKGQGEKGAQEKDADKEKDEDIVIPAGADPADLKVIRGAQAMLKAEKRLAELLKAGKIKGIDMILPFEEIAAWPYEDGLKGMPKQLAKLDGKKVMMTGFMLPIDEVENIKEFLLVQSLWSCCFGQPPDINGTVRVVMQGKKRIDYKFDPIKVVGTFRIKATVEDGFCVDIYQLEADSVEVIE